MESAQDGQALPPALRTARELDAQGQWERLERDQQGYASTDALMAIAASLSRIPGRKTIVFIAEGLALPDNVFPHFQDVVATANRGNVAIYAMDAAGLRVQSTQAETAAEINNAGRMAVEVGADGTSGGGVAFMERLSGTLRKDPHAALTLLAAQTGGFLMDGSNDLAKSLQAIEIDQQSYYLLTYTPRNMDFRGEWRRLAIRVPGREVTVRGRSGYVAVRASGSQPLLAYEGPALAALDRKTEPKDIPIRAMTLQFPEPNGGTAVAVFLTAPAADLLFRSSADTYSTDATLFARIRGADGAVLQKASEPVRLNGPTLDLPRARAASLALYRHLVLAPGSYLLEGVVHDGLAGRAGVSRVPFTIEPSPPGALRVSSIVLVGQADAIQGAGNSDDPLRLGAVQLMPSGGQPICKSMVSKLTFFYTAVAPGSDKPTATLEFLRGESLVATVPLTIPDAGPAGSIQHLARLPLDTLVPGEYVLRLIVRQGAQRQVREAPFQLLP